MENLHLRHISRAGKTFKPLPLMRTQCHCRAILGRDCQISDGAPSTHHHVCTLISFREVRAKLSFPTPTSWSHSTLISFREVRAKLLFPHTCIARRTYSTHTQACSHVFSASIELRSWTERPAGIHRDARRTPVGEGNVWWWKELCIRSFR